MAVNVLPLFNSKSHFPPPTRSIDSPIPFSPLLIFFAKGRGTHQPQSPRVPWSSLAVFFQGMVRANGARVELKILQVDVSRHVVALYKILWPSDHFLYRPFGPRSSALAAAASSPAILWLGVTDKLKRGEGWNLVGSSPSSFTIPPPSSFFIPPPPLFLLCLSSSSSSPFPCLWFHNQIHFHNPFIKKYGGGRSRLDIRQSSCGQLGRSSNAKTAQNSKIWWTYRPTRQGVESRVRD